MPQWNVDQRLAQMIDLGMVGSPTDETVQFFHDHLNDPEQATQARYGLGSAAFNLQDEAPERATAIVRELEQHFASASTLGERMDYLKALGNAGSIDALPLIQEQLTSDNANLRAVAIDSLRHIDGEQVDVLLAHSLAQDNSEAVRAAAADTAGTRPLTEVLAQALAAAWHKDPASLVRNTALAAIQRLDRQYPGLLARVE